MKTGHSAHAALAISTWYLYSHRRTFTLTGPPGSGKSTAIREAAEKLERFAPTLILHGMPGFWGGLMLRNRPLVVIDGVDTRRRLRPVGRRTVFVGTDVADADFQVHKFEAEMPFAPRRRGPR